MNRFTNLDIYDVIMDADGEGSFSVVADEQVIDWIETLRKANGQEDFLLMENDIYYDFYVTFSFKKREVKLIGVANNTEKDDYVNYECKLTPEEKEFIMWLIIYELSRETA